MHHMTPAESQRKTCWQVVRFSLNANWKSNSCKVLATSNTLINSAPMETIVGSQENPMRMGAGQPLDINSAPVLEPYLRALSPHSTLFHFSHQLRESYLVLVMRSLVPGSILLSCGKGASIFSGKPSFSHCQFKHLGKTDFIP